MSAKASNEQQAIRYLLGELSEAEQARLEERFFHDAALSELLSEAEDDLIDQYVREELSAGEREGFEQRFLISQRRREKVGFARALRQAEKGTAAAVVKSQQPLTWWQRMLSALSTPRPALAYSLAAAVLLFLVGGWWLFSEMRHLRSEAVRMAAERESRALQNDQLRAQTVEERRRSDELAAEKEKLEQELARLKQQAELPGNETRPAPTLAFILMPGSRSGEGSKNLIVPRAVGTVRLQLNLRSGDDYRAYQVRLQTASGATVRSWKQLKASSAKGQRAVFIAVPAELLKTGVQYELTLSGVAGPNRLQDLGYYYFNFLKN